ncbi:hypothetical protein F8388_005185 [Cannabis sativa]|uniref:DUF4378 domain-containing protein n=1 Tax=Cannabis sativa TaxID=3483 RepID=A0A7J6ECD5_CANSA|nr:hypothetical protein F8388_005185 [Cannabis sativa]
MFNEFVMGRSRDLINPRLFNVLENRKGPLDRDVGGGSKMRRKVLFDCVGECLDLRYRRCLGGGYRMWLKGVAMVRRKEWLAEEVYKEISGWESMGDSMVDELVDKDMSSQYGKWLDFELSRPPQPSFQFSEKHERSVPHLHSLFRYLTSGFHWCHGILQHVRLHELIRGSKEALRRVHQSL